MTTIRLANADEAARLTELALRSKAHWGYDARFMARCREELTVRPEEIVDGLTYVRERDEGLLLGFYALAPIARTGMELNFLFVEPRSIGQGHGRALMEHAKQLARARGVAVLEIQGDPNATRFYEAAGGRLVGTRPSASIPGRVLPLFEIDLRIE